MTIADRIVERRLELQLTQEQVAHKMGYNGRDSISKIEKSGDNITLKKLRRIADVLDTTQEYLLGLEHNDELTQKFSRLTDKQKRVVMSVIDSYLDV